jgi:hypothetical protein
VTEATVVTKRWDGCDIHGARSRGRGRVFAAFDWRDLVLATGGPIERKAQMSSGRLSAFDPGSQVALKKRDGCYCDLQSINSEDTVTWSVFGVYSIDLWAGDLLSLAFPADHSAVWNVLFWQRLPHPEDGKIQHGPEADVILKSDSTWAYAIEAKWTADIDRKQGRSLDKTQLEMRAASVKSQLVIAPKPSRYQHARRVQSTFCQYFQGAGDQYVPTPKATALGVKAITWEQIEQLLANCPEAAAIEASTYLRWRLAQLDVLA